MTTQELPQTRNTKFIELSGAIATGVALGAGISPATGAGVGVTMCILALRGKQKPTLREGVLLVVGAVAAGIFVGGLGVIIAHWSDFKEGFAQGYMRK